MHVCLKLLWVSTNPAALTEELLAQIGLSHLPFTGVMVVVDGKLKPVMEKTTGTPTNTLFGETEETDATDATTGVFTLRIDCASMDCVNKTLSSFSDESLRKVAWISLVFNVQICLNCVPNLTHFLTSHAPFANPNVLFSGRYSPVTVNSVGTLMLTELGVKLWNAVGVLLATAGLVVFDTGALAEVLVIVSLLPDEQATNPKQAKPDATKVSAALFFMLMSLSLLHYFVD